MNITDINAGDRIKCTITAGLKAEAVDGVVFFAGKLEFNASRLDYARTLSVRSATDPRKVWAFTTLDVRGEIMCEPAPRLTTFTGPKGAPVLTLNAWRRDGVYRTADGRYARIEMNYASAEMDLVVREIASDRPLTGEVL